MTQGYIAIVFMHANQLHSYCRTFIYIIMRVVCVLYEGLLLAELCVSESNA